MTHTLTLAFRRIRNRPTTALVMSVTLALGIGLNLVAFTVLSSVVFKPLPYPQSGSLYVLRINTESGTAPMSSLEYAHLSRAATQLESIGAYRFGFATMKGGRQTVALTRSSVTPTFWTTLRAAPLLGKVFTDRNRKLALISYSVWMEQFQRNPNVLGAAIEVEGVPHEIGGVMPLGFSFPSGTQIWTPLSAELETVRLNLPGVIARIKSNTTEPAVEAELNHLLAQLRDSRPETGAGRKVVCVSLLDYLVGRARSSLFALAAVAVCVLLITCANLAGLLLADGFRRVPEIAIRNALGAGRGRIVLELLVETLILSAMAGIAAVVLAYGVLPALLARIPVGTVPRLHEIRLDGQALLYAVALSLATSALIGVIPALYLSRTSPNELVKSGSSRSVAGNASGLAQALVSAQVGLVLVMLVFSGLMIRTVTNLRSVRLGFEPVNLYSVTVLPRQVRNLKQMKTACEEVLARITSAPGVQSAAVSNWMPFGNSTLATSVGPEGRSDLFDELVAVRMAVSHTYFSTIGVRILNGRAFDAAESRFSGAVVISESLAKRAWPGADPLGRRLTFSAASYSQPEPGAAGQSSSGWLTVVGVTEDVKQSNLRDPAPMTVYQPFAQADEPRLLSQVVYLARSARTDLDLTPTMRKTIGTSAIDQPIYSAGSVQELIDGSISERKLQASLLSAFSVLAFLVAVTGIYGTMTSYTNRTRRDLGIRLALGAQRNHIYRASLYRSALLVLPGIVIGLGLVLLVSNAIRKFLFALNPTDPATLAACSGALLLASLLAGYLPVRRALRSKVIHELRSE